MSFLEIKHVTKRFGNALAVDDLSLDIEQGEFLSLLGPSGCGKTTTLQMIAGFVDASAGEIMLAGQTLAGVPAQKRDIGIVFQSYALFPHMTVRENVAFGLLMRKVDKHEIGNRVDKVLALVRLDTLGERYPKQLSGGQRQRVALARAIVIDPPLLLLDEPLSNLDAKLREEMQVELRRICRTAGVTTILVTHDQAEALALSDRIAVLRNGRLEQLGTPSEIYRAPATAFVGNFIGKMNLWDVAPAASRDGQMVIRAGNIQLGASRVPEHARGSASLAAGIRPQAIVFTAPGTERLAGTVATRVYQGDHVLYMVTTPLGNVMVQAGHGSDALRVDEGQQVFLDWADEDLCVMRGDAQ
jgi:putative spermidine/putrescine transport system ATP-binding protein